MLQPTQDVRSNQRALRRLQAECDVVPDPRWASGGNREISVVCYGSHIGYRTKLWLTRSLDDSRMVVANFLNQSYQRSLLLEALPLESLQS